jgi:tRNA-modifying protein YgfZ
VADFEMTDPGGIDPVACSAARDAVALEAAAAATVLELAGPDRVRFLHNLCTADVRSLAAGESTRGFATTVQGKVVASLELLALEESLLALLPAGSAERVVEHFTRYRIVERVEISARPELELARLRGPLAAAALEAIELPPVDAPGAHRQVGSSDGGVRVRRVARGREPRFELLGTRAALDQALARLRGSARALGLAELGPADAELLRVEDGEVRFGVDYGSEAFPQETGDELAVSYSKGCYLGQEVIARIHYRGGVQRAPRGLRFEDGPPPLGTVLLHEGRDAGRATSVAPSPRFGAIGLALIHRRVGEPPGRVELAGGGVARIVSLPFE